MEAALRAALPARAAVGATACAQADVEIADTIVTSIRKARRFMLSSVFCAGSSEYPLRMRLSNVCSRLHLPPLGHMSPLLAPSGGSGTSAFAPLMGGKRKARHICETALLIDSVEKVASTRTAKIHLSQI